MAVNFLFQVVPGKRFNDVVRKIGVSLTTVCMGLPSYQDVTVDGSGLYGVGEIRLMPDLSTKRRIPWYLDSLL